MTPDEIKKALEALTPEERAKLMEETRPLTKVEEYENATEETIIAVVDLASNLSDTMRTVKDKITAIVDKHRQKLAEYTALTNANKLERSFKLVSKNKLLKIEYAVQERFSFDERGDQAEQLVREVITEMANDKAKEAFGVVLSLLERSREGKLDPRQIQKLKKHKELIPDERFQRAMDLFDEAYRSDNTVPYIRAYVRSSTEEKWRMIELNFSSIGQTKV